MNQLIAIQTSNISNEVKQTVNARDLHAFLEVATEFRHWMKRRIDDFGFVENQDFTTTVKNDRSIDYHLTLDMAKELSMVERNDKGKQARQYFIECEKKSSQLPTDPILAQLQILTAMRQDVISHDQRLAILEAKTTTRDESYFTAAGFCNLKGIKLDRAGMAMIGKMASSFSRDNNLKVGKVYDSRYGEVNEYHVSALQHAVEA